MTNLLSVMGCLAIAFVDTPPAPDTQITVDGLVRLIEQIDVPARSEGRLIKVHVKEGNVVSRGDALGQLNDGEAQLTLKRAQTELQLASEKAQSETSIQVTRLTRDVSVSEFKRAQHAKEISPSSISASEYDRLRLDTEKSGLELTRLSEERRFAFFASQTKAIEVQMARLALDERQITSPIDGIVVQVHRREGEWIRPGEKAIRVVRIDRLRVEAYVSLNLALATLENAAAVLQIPGANSSVQEFAGEVVFVNPEADPVNGQIRIWAEIENRDRLLRPGQRGRLKISLKDTPSTPSLALPPSAVEMR